MDRRRNSDQLYMPVDLETPNEPSAGMTTSTCSNNHFNKIRQKADEGGVDSIDPWIPGVDDDYVEPKERMRGGRCVDGYEKPNDVIKMKMARKSVRHVNVAVNQIQDNKESLGEELTYKQSVDNFMIMTPAIKKVVPIGFVNKVTEKPSSPNVRPVLASSRSKHISSIMLVFGLTIIASAVVTLLQIGAW